MPFVSFYCFWVVDGPALAVCVAHKHLAVVANFACDLNRFFGGISLHGVILHIVLRISRSAVNKAKAKQIVISIFMLFSLRYANPGRHEPHLVPDGALRVSGTALSKLKL
jgi:hypothetical protein